MHGGDDDYSPTSRKGETQIRNKQILWIAVVIGLSAVILDLILQSRVLVSRYAFPILFSVFSVCVALTTFALFRLRVRELENAQTSSRKDLRDSEARFEHIFNSSPIPLFVTSLSTGKVQAANESAILQFGLAGVDPTGLSAPDFYVIQPSGLNSPSVSQRMAGRITWYS